MIKKTVIVVLLLLVLGFYFFPNTTKDIVDSTAHVVKDTTKKTFDKIKNDEKVKEKIEIIKDNVSEELDGP